MEFTPGDIQLLHNHTVFHDRTAFEDWPEPERKRHLLRLVALPADGRPLPERYAARWGSITIGDRGGIVCRGTRLHAPLTPGVGPPRIPRHGDPPPCRSPAESMPQVLLQRGIFQDDMHAGVPEELPPAGQAEELHDAIHGSVALLCSAIARYSLARSMPTDFRPRILATDMVVPVPQKGSRTSPPTGR